MQLTYKTIKIVRIGWQRADLANVFSWRVWLGAATRARWRFSG